MKIDYKRWVIDNQIRLNYKVLAFEDLGDKVLLHFRCETCGAERVVDVKSLYKNNQGKQTVHGERCSSYYFSLQDKELGINHRKQFKNFYRYAKDRCTNPNSKDYERYKGKWGFRDYTDYYLNCWEEYKKAIQLYPTSKLSIDRINGHKGYESNNVRFIPMEDNLRNKECVKRIRLENVKDGDVFIADSLRLASVYLFGDVSHASAITRAIKKGNLYHKTWRITYFD